MVRSILRVIFNHENRGLRPEFGAAHGLDQLPKRQVIIGDQRGGSAFAPRRAGRVIIWQTNDLQARHVPLSLESFQLGNEPFGALHVREVQVETGIAFIDVPL